MEKPVFRNPDKFQVLPLREYLREELPPGSAGCVVEDLDLLVRHYGMRYGLDATGRFMLIEQKHPGSFIGTAQQMTFGLVHSVLRKGDPDRERYLGYYVLEVAFDEGQMPVFPVRVNRKYTLDRAQFVEWMNGALVLPSLFDQETNGNGSQTH